MMEPETTKMKNNHPYYNSDRKKTKEDFSINIIGWSFIVIVIMLLTSLAVRAQDTTCVMITLDEVITFNYQTSKIIEREPIQGITTLRVEEYEVLCLHLRDKKKRYRDVTTTFDDGDHRHDTFKSKDDVYFTPYGFGAIWVEIGRPKRTKNK